MQPDRILFIGNSFTYFNDMPRIFELLCNSRGLRPHLDSITRGGWELRKHADPEDPSGMQVESALQKKWDVVILQDHSIFPCINPRAFLRSVVNLSDRVRVKGGDVALYATWAYEEGSEKLINTGMTYQQMSKTLHDRYEEASALVHAPVVPVGDAFARVTALHPSIRLLDGDHFHPSLDGSYLVACMFLLQLMGESPIGLPHYPGMDASTAEVLQRAAQTFAS